MKLVITDAVKKFWKSESGEQHVCVDTTVRLSEKLRAMATDVRGQLDSLITKFEGSQISFEKLNKQFKNIQPRAVALAQEMVRYDPRYIPEDLSYDSPDIPVVLTMRQSLTEPKALPILRRMSRSLGELLESVKV
jgi:hypothetical protein